MSEEHTIKKIKSGLFDRGFSLTKFALQSGASIAKTGIRGAFSGADAREAQFKSLLEGQAKLLAQELGHLKGSLMKVGQMLALYGEHFLPEEVANALKSLHEQSIPVAWKEIDRLLRTRLTAELYAELEVDPKPLAAASMGQVHRATIRSTGEMICLKIQYPGVDAAVDTDIKALRSLLSMFRFIPTHSQGYDQLFQEIREMLHQELDYKQEKAFTEEALQLLAAMPVYLVPQVYPRYSNQTLLATSFEQGVGLDSPEVRALSLERRSRLGEAFSRLFLKELFEFRMMQTDPHFGNYKVRLQDDGEDQLILLDWGAVRRFTPEFIAQYQTMVLGAFHGREDLVITAGLQLGLLRADDTPEMRASFVELTSMVIEPWLPPRDPRVPARLVDGQGRYKWAESDLPSRVTTMATRYALSFKMRPPPREILFLDRKIGGVFIILKILNARFEGHKILIDESLSKWGPVLP